MQFALTFVSSAAEMFVGITNSILMIMNASVCWMKRFNLAHGNLVEATTTIMAVVEIEASSSLIKENQGTWDNSLRWCC